MKCFPKVLKTDYFELRALAPTFENAKMFLDGLERQDKRARMVFCQKDFDELSNVENVYEWMKSFNDKDDNKDNPFKYGRLYGAFVDGEYAGFIEFIHLWLETRSVEIGGYMRKKFEGRWVVPQVLKLVENELFGKLDWHKIEIGHNSGNNITKYIAERNGYKQEARLRDANKINGQYYDQLYYGKLKSEWSGFIDNAPKCF